MKLEGIVLSALAALAIGCGSKSHGASVSVSAKGAEVAAAAPSAPLDLGNGILLERVRAVIRKLVLEPEDDATVPPTCAACQGVECRDADEDGLTETEHDHDGDTDDDVNDVVLGPLLVDLSGETLAGGLDQIFGGTIPAGTYEELELVIGPITAAQAGSDAGLAEMAARNASVIVEGTIDGAPFTFVSSLATEFDIEGHAVVSSGGTANVTISMGPKHWFGATGAGRCDPTDPAQKEMSERLIRAAVHAFQDDDRDGHDDHAGNAHTGDGPCDD